MYARERIDEAVRRIVLGYSPERVILFGSYARGTATDDSDVDLLVIKQTSAARTVRSAEALKCVRGLGIPLDIVVYTREELTAWSGVQTSFAAAALRDGMVMYG